MVVISCKICKFDFVQKIRSNVCRPCAIKNKKAKKKIRNKKFYIDNRTDCLRKNKENYKEYYENNKDKIKNRRKKIKIFNQFINRNPDINPYYLIMPKRRCEDVIIMKAVKRKLAAKICRRVILIKKKEILLVKNIL